MFLNEHKFSINDLTNQVKGKASEIDMSICKQFMTEYHYIKQIVLQEK